MIPRARLPTIMISQKSKTIDKHCPPIILDWIYGDLKDACARVQSMLRACHADLKQFDDLVRRNAALVKEIAELKREVRRLRDPIQQRESKLHHAKKEYKHEKQKIKDVYGIK